MPSLENLTGSPYLSYSSMDSFLTCGERYRLEKVVGVPQAKAWYLLGGSAVHEATELCDTEQMPATEAWTRAWQRQLDEAGDTSNLRAGGRASKEWPNKENGDWWSLNGLAMVQSWVRWRDAHIAQGWTLLSVEQAFEVQIGSAFVRGFIDRTFVNPNGEAVVVDIKTGVHTPASTLQLGIYRLGLLALEDSVEANLGSYWMARKGELSEPKSLLHYTEELVGGWMFKTQTAIEAEVFVPHVTSLCSSCSVAQYCVAVGGTPPRIDSLTNATSH